MFVLKLDWVSVVILMCGGRVKFALALVTEEGWFDRDEVSGNREVLLNRYFHT